MTSYKLNNFLMDIVVNNKFYKKRLTNPYTEEITLEKFPVLHKQEIRENYDNLLSLNYKKENLLHERTNGTTERKPLDLYKSNEERILLDLALWKERMKVDKEALKKIVIFFYNHDNLYEEARVKNDSSRIMIHVPMNRKNEDEYLQDLKLMEREKVSWIMGPASLIYFLAKISDKNALNISINVIEFTSEYVPKFYQNFIEKTFNSVCVAQYSCHELWGIGFGSPYKMKVMDNIILEDNINQNFSRELNNVIVTSTLIKSMPFIKYYISDLIFKDKDYIKTFGFRSTDIIEFSDVEIPCWVIDNIFNKYFKEKLLPLENYQIIYEKKEKKINIIFVNLEEKFCLNVINILEMELQLLNMIDIDITYKIREKFYRDNLTGKIRGIISQEHINETEIW